MLNFSQEIQIECLKRNETYVGVTNMVELGKSKTFSIIICSAGNIRFCDNKKYLKRKDFCTCGKCNIIPNDSLTWGSAVKQYLFLETLNLELIEKAPTLMKLVYFSCGDGYICCNSPYCLLRATKNNKPFDKGLFTSKNKYQIQNINKYIKENRKDYVLLTNKTNLTLKEICYFKYIGDGLSKNSCRYFKMSLDKFIHAECKHPNLIMSKGEKKIADFLTTNNFTYKTNYMYDDCINIKRLKFDFAVHKNKKFICLIEFDGAQHDKEMGFAKGHSLEYRQNNDKLKTDYCNKHNIPFLRINHKDYNSINSILIDFLK